MSETESPFSAAIPFVAAGVMFVVGTALIAAYPAVMVVCLYPGWRSFLEAWAISGVFCAVLMVAIIVSVVCSKEPL